MSKAAVNKTPELGVECVVYNFTEESCYDKREQFRDYRCPVVFRLFSVGKALGAKVDVTFVDDYGVYYGDDTQLISALEQAVPGVNWQRGWVFHRWLDHTRIQILNADTGRVVAQMETRRYEGRSVRPEAIEAGQHGENIMTMGQVRAKASELQAAAEAAARER